VARRRAPRPHCGPVAGVVGGPGQAATIEYVVRLATGQPCLPAGEHVYLSCHSPLSDEGLAVEDATMWAPDGRVLAVARQTRLAGA
jgi:acyl-CoA thioesterase